MKKPQRVLVRTEDWKDKSCKVCKKPFERRSEVIEREDFGRIERWCVTCYFRMKI